MTVFVIYWKPEKQSHPVVWADYFSYDQVALFLFIFENHQKLSAYKKGLSKSKDVSQNIMNRNSQVIQILSYR